MARTSGGTPGPDSGLMAACAEAEALLAKPYLHAAPAPAPGEPVAVVRRNSAGQISMQTPEGAPFDMSRHVGTSLYAGPAPAVAHEPAPTYSSTQATECAGCGERKHTPLRIDAMGGYVCLTCIDKKLGGLLGEFGYEDDPQRKDAERYRFIRDADRSDCITHELSLYAMESLDEYVDAAMEGEAAIADSKPPVQHKENGNG